MRMARAYADLHFLIPELIENVEVNKGPYYAEYGDFATAGAVRLDTREAFKENRVQATAGMFNTYRALAMLSLKDAPLKPMLAAEVYRSDGPFDNPENMERYNLYMKTPLIRDDNPYLGRYLDGIRRGLERIRADSRAGGRVGARRKYGSIDPSEGGSSQRYSASAQYLACPARARNGRPRPTGSITACRCSPTSPSSRAIPFNGDEINQRDARSVAGLNASYKRKYDFRARTAWGLAQLRDRRAQRRDP